MTSPTTSSTSGVGATHPLLRLLRYAHGYRYRGRILLAATFSILNKLFDLAPPVLIGAAIDVVVRREHSLIASFGFQSLVAQLWVLAILTLLIWGLESLFEYIYAILWRNLAQSLQHDLRLDAFSHMNTLEMRFFEEQSTGRLIAVLSDDVNQLERFLDGGANDLLQVMTTVVAVSAFFIAASPVLGLLAVIPIPAVVWGSLVFQKRIAPRYIEVRRDVGELNNRLANSIGGVATIKSFNAEAFEQSQMTAVSEAYRQSNRRAIRLSSAFSPLIRMVIVIGFTTTLIYGGWLALNDQLNTGLYGTLVFLTQRLLWPLTRLGTTLDLYQRAMASTRRILDLLDRRPVITSGRTQLPTETVRGEIALENVSFAYHPGQRVLHNVTLHVPHHTTAAFVGPTGSGKTTIIKLLLRFYDINPDDPDHSGCIRIDGHDIRAVALEDLRRAIALVSQDIFLFHGTVRENIAYGLADTPHFDPAAVALDRIVEAARAAEAHEFIERLPDGYDTIVGERGQRLSGGQRQRLSMARAILKDAPVLILDEATSAVDNETEAAIQRSLHHIAHQRTTIVIAHRLSTVRHADVIFILDDGRVTEQGTHDELIESDGLYAHLWAVQTGEAALLPIETVDSGERSTKLES